MESALSSERTDLTVFARDYPEALLIVEVKPAAAAPPDEDSSVKHVARRMWGANCHYGLVMTPATTYVLRDDFNSSGPEAMHVTDVLSTAKLLSRVAFSGTAPIPQPQLAFFAREWLQQLTSFQEAALPDDADVVRGFFPDLVAAVADGRVVTEVSA